MDKTKQKFCHSTKLFYPQVEDKKYMSRKSVDDPKKFVKAVTGHGLFKQHLRHWIELDDKLFLVCIFLASMEVLPRNDGPACLGKGFTNWKESGKWYTILLEGQENATINGKEQSQRRVLRKGYMHNRNSQILIGITT